MEITKTASRDFEGELVVRAFKAICLLALVLPICLLGVLIVDTFMDGLPRLSWKFLTSLPSRKPEQAGILPALAGSAFVVSLAATMVIPVGVGAAVYLEEYAKPGFITNLIEVNIANLAGVPSIIYGLLGLELFVRAMRLERSVIAGAATLALLVLPMVIMASREALRTIPDSIREACLALGAEKFSMVLKVLLPMSLPGILTGIILSLARALGEAAPLVTLGALTYVAFIPDSLKSPFTALPIQIFNWISRPQAGFHVNAAAGIVVLLLLMLVMNSAALILRNRLQRKIIW